MKSYEAPDVTEYGSVESLTEKNKVGFGEDEFSQVTDGVLQGSVVPAS